MTAAEIARALAGQRPVQRLDDGGYLVSCPVPGHGKGRGDRCPSLRIADGHSSLLIHCFGRCKPRDVLAELKRRGLLADAPASRAARRERAPAPNSGISDREQRQHAKAAWLWRHRRPLEGTCAERYLREARGYAGSIPATLAFLPPTKPEHSPALITAFGLPDEREPGTLAAPCAVDSVHLTLLRPDGTSKADVEHPKLVVGRPLGRPIALAPANDLLGLVICEGIEDTLSAHQATGLGAWAAGSAGFMPALAGAVPDHIECVTVYAHPDKAGQDGARALAAALINRNKEVRVEGIT
jgi:hypothetical protein